MSPLTPSVPELAGRIRSAVVTVTLDLFNVWNETADIIFARLLMVPSLNIYKM
jgi:hypothetical protein